MSERKKFLLSGPIIALISHPLTSRPKDTNCHTPNDGLAAESNRMDAVQVLHHFKVG